jgi:transcriptional regulator with XRE-family HTH domain
MDTKDKPQTKHLGRKVGRLREFLGIKQEAVADQLGISQQAVSKLEQSEHIEDSMLERIGKVLGVSAEAIKNFSEEAVVNIIANTFQDESSAYVNNYKGTFNPLDKYIEAIEANKKLYEALIKEKDEKIALLQKVLDGKK